MKGLDQTTTDRFYSILYPMHSAQELFEAEAEENGYAHAISYRSEGLVREQLVNQYKSRFEAAFECALAAGALDKLFDDYRGQRDQLIERRFRYTPNLGANHFANGTDIARHDALREAVRILQMLLTTLAEILDREVPDPAVNLEYI